MLNSYRGFIGWQAQIGVVADSWNHVLLAVPVCEINIIANHRPLHQRIPFTPELFDRWLRIFHDTIDGVWDWSRRSRRQQTHHRRRAGNVPTIPRPRHLATQP